MKPGIVKSEDKRLVMTRLHRKNVYKRVGTLGHNPSRGAELDVDLLYAITKFLWESQMTKSRFAINVNCTCHLVENIRKGMMLRQPRRDRILDYIKNYSGPMRSGW
jgi:hypothetical protein